MLLFPTRGHAMARTLYPPSTLCSIHVLLNLRAPGGGEFTAFDESCLWISPAILIFRPSYLSPWGY
jgi:hypothetical protein